MPGSTDWLSALRDRRVLAGVAAGGVALSAAGGYAAYAYAETSVTVSVDGEEQEVKFLGRSVERALSAADVVVADEDRVVPAVTDSVGDGDTIVVTQARDFTVTTDGTTNTHRVAVTTVGEAVDVLALDVDGARLSVDEATPISLDGLSVELLMPREFVVKADGAANPFTAAVANVGEALTEAGVVVGTEDLVTPPAEAPVTPGMEISVVRVVSEEVTRTEAIKFETKTTKDATLTKGTTKVVKAGVAGEKTIVEKVVKHDGVEVERTEVRGEVTKAPVTKEVAVGTKVVPAADTGGDSSDGGSSDDSGGGTTSPAVPAGSVWDRLAECESGGNWSINTGNGYYGGLQFSASSWRAVGGTGLPHQHSRETQIAFAEKLKAKQGWGAWPACSRKLGLR